MQSLNVLRSPLQTPKSVQWSGETKNTTGIAVHKDVMQIQEWVFNSCQESNLAYASNILIGVLEQNLGGGLLTKF